LRELLRREVNIVILRLAAVLIAGPVLSIGFIALFSTLHSRASNLMFEFVARILGLGFEGGIIPLVVTLSAIAVIFSIVLWLVLRTWGPLHKQAKPPLVRTDL